MQIINRGSIYNPSKKDTKSNEQLNKLKTFATFNVSISTLSNKLGLRICKLHNQKNILKKFKILNLDHGTTSHVDKWLSQNGNTINIKKDDDKFVFSSFNCVENPIIQVVSDDFERGLDWLNDQSRIINDKEPPSGGGRYIHSLVHGAPYSPKTNKTIRLEVLGENNKFADHIEKTPDLAKLELV